MKTCSSEVLECEQKNIEKAESILRRPFLRPSPTVVQNLTFEDVDNAAKILDYPIRNIDTFINFQRNALTLIEDKVKTLLIQHEPNKPKYIFFARDGELMYDAMLSVVEGTEIADRIHLVRLSRGSVEQVERWPEFENNFEKNRTYFAQEGMAQSDFQDSNENFVFVDSGYQGSMFNAVLNISGVSREEMGERLMGYLVFREASPYRELGWTDRKLIEHNKFAEEFYETFGKQWEGLRSWSCGIMEYPDFKKDRQFNWALAHWMQIQPKYCDSSFNIEKVDEKWVGIPYKDRRTYPFQEYGFADIKSVLDPIPHPNAAATDPVAAMKLQLITTSHFSSQEVRKRILRDVISTNTLPIQVGVKKVIQPIIKTS